MKKSFKRAGVAVLSMAMLLSMGAVGAMTASAAPDTSTKSVIVTDGVKFAYQYSKIASLDTDGVTYTVESAWDNYFEVDASNYLNLKTAFNSKTKLSEFAASGVSASDRMDLAKEIAGYSVTDGTYTTMSSDNLSLTPGFYVFKSATAQPIIIEIKQDELLRAKGNKIDINKKIVTIDGVNTNVAKASTDNPAIDGKTGVAQCGSVVAFQLDSQLPVYDSAVTVAAPYTITDIPEDTLTIDDSSIEVYLDGTKLTKDTDYTLTTGVNNTNSTVNGEPYFTETNADTAGTGFKVVIKNNIVVDSTNMGKAVKVTFNATVADSPDVNTDANNNTATLEYGNDYTVGGLLTPGSHPGDEPSPDTEEDSEAKVYCALLTVNKVDQDSHALEGATFAVYKNYVSESAPGTLVKEIVGTNASTFEFTGLSVGDYTLVETATPSADYVKVDPINFTVTTTDAKTTGYAGNFTITSSTATISSNAVTVMNVKGQALPGTGGMGTVLFTVGGAAIVLLAGALFVVYLRKRKTEE